MEIAEQKATFKNVVGLLKWGSVGVAATVALLVLWFCTPAGFVPGFAVAAIIVLAGFVLLRQKRTPVAH
jgi:MFS superfamily sulfate permease-like transporter